MRRWPWILLILVSVLFIRVFFAVQTPYFSSDSAYFHKQAVERIAEGDSPWVDELGFGGRTVVFSPVFEFVLSVFTKFFPLETSLKVVPNLLASFLVIPVFFIAFRLTGSLEMAGASSLLASIVPVFISKTFNHISPLSLAIPLFFFLVYFWMSDKVMAFVVLLLIFAFVHPISLVLVLSIGFYFVLCALDRIKLEEREYELGIFTIFFTLWVQFLIFKRLLVFHGPAVVWRNLPVELLSSLFAKFSLIQAIVQIGAYPVAQGVYALYKTVLKTPVRDVNFLFAIVMTSGILLWVKVIDLSSGLMLLGISLAIMFSRWSLLLYQYLKQTRISSFAGLITATSILIALVTTAYPAYAAIGQEIDYSITAEDVQALEWMRGNLPDDSIVISPVNYGHYVAAIAKRKTVIDSYFFLQERVEERFEDVNRLYITSFETEAVDLFDKYGATHIVVPPGVPDVKYANAACFSRVYEMRTRIYEKDPDCKVRVV